MATAYAFQPATVTASATDDSTRPVAGPDRWLERVTGSTKQFFDVAAHHNGSFLRYVVNYFDAFDEAYEIKSTDVAAAVGLRGSAVALGLDDDAWMRYHLGAQLGILDSGTSGPMATNRFIHGSGDDAESIVGLMGRGAVFLACRNSLLGLGAALALPTNADAATTYSDLRRSLLPGIFLVPAMVATINRAQVHGFTYAAYT